MYINTVKEVSCFYVTSTIIFSKISQTLLSPRLWCMWQRQELERVVVSAKDPIYTSTISRHNGTKELSLWLYHLITPLTATGRGQGTGQGSATQRYRGTILTGLEGNIDWHQPEPSWVKAEYILGLGTRHVCIILQREKQSLNDVYVLPLNIAKY